MPWQAWANLFLGVILGGLISLLWEIEKHERRKNGKR